MVSARRRAHYHTRGRTHIQQAWHVLPTLTYATQSTHLPNVLISEGDVWAQAVVSVGGERHREVAESLCIEIEHNTTHTLTALTLAHNLTLSPTRVIICTHTCTPTCTALHAVSRALTAGTRAHTCTSTLAVRTGTLALTRAPTAKLSAPQ